MNTFCLMDGAMAVNVLSASSIFNDPEISWLTPLFPAQEFRLVAPFLVDFEALPPGSPQRRELDRALAAYPRRLHVAQIDTEWSAHDLGQHLYRFARFRDSHGDTYALRLADSRVMLYLPRILTERQWRELSAPIAKWRINDRRGVTRTIHESKGACEPFDGKPEIFRLSDEQIEQLMQASEPDSLLNAIKKQPTLQDAHRLQLHYDAAFACLDYWKGTGNPSRGTLHRFAYLVFEREPERFKDVAWLGTKFRQALGTTV